MSIVYIILALLMLMIMVTVHEWGHFIGARMTGIPVREFSIGFGPKLVQWRSRKHETVFSLRLIPAGGYCAFYGEDDPDEKADEDPRAMRGYAVWKRLLTVFMGPFMNFVLAFIVALGFVWFGGIAQNEYDLEGYRVISQVNAGGAADLAGFKVGDVMKSVNGTDAAGLTADGQDARIRELINQYGADGRELEITVMRGEQDITLTVTPQADKTGRMLIGIVLETPLLRTETLHPGFLQAVSLSAQLCVRYGSLVLESIGMIIKGQAGIQDMSGPVGVISYVAEETRVNGKEAYLSLLIFISVNLGLFNLMPIPGLDGAQIILLLIEGVRRRPLSRKVEAYIKLTGFALLMLLFLVLTFKDVSGIFGGK